MIDRCRRSVPRTPSSSVRTLLCASLLVAGTATGAAAMPNGSSGRTLDTSVLASIRGRAGRRSESVDAYLRRFGRNRVTAALAADDADRALAVHARKSIPAFARKYGLPCSACHTTWPQLNNFGQVFRDNGYRLKNDKDSPVDQAPSYWPIAARVTPQFRSDKSTHQQVDAVAGDPNSGRVEKTMTQQGFDISGIDLLMLGTLSKNISFGLIPAAEQDGAFHIEAAYVRFNELMNTTWANLKAGKFELDNIVSEKRELLLSGNGGFYQMYHFVPVGDGTSFGMGDNQIGMELSGHSVNSYTRYSAGVFSSTDGEVGLGAGKGYDGAVAFSQAFDAGALGLERIGAYAYRGSRPTTYETLDGEPVPGSGLTTKGFYRMGLAGDFYFGKLELLPLYMRAQDDVRLATDITQPVPAGAQSPVWNAGLLEAHFFVHQQLVLMGRHERIRMSKQAVPGTSKDLGDIDATAVGVRWYPIMLARDGLALHAEYSFSNTTGAAPLSGIGTGEPPLDPATKVRSSSIFLALDFAF